MAREEIFHISTDTKRGIMTMRLVCNYDDPPAQNIYSTGREVDFADFGLNITQGDLSVTISARAHFRDNTLNLDISNISDPVVVCILACAGSTFVRSLIECFNRDIKLYIRCLKAKGIDMATGIARCAIRCFVTDAP